MIQRLAVGDEASGSVGSEELLHRNIFYGSSLEGAVRKFFLSLFF